MQIDGKNISVPSEEEKEESWRKLCYSWAEEAENAHKYVDVTLGTLMAIELTGGKCPKCSVEWELVEFNNIMAKGQYYRPTCNCYYSCPRCKYSLHRDDVSGKLADNDYFCTNCGFPLNGLATKQRLESIDNEYTRKLYQRYYESFRK